MCEEAGHGGWGLLFLSVHQTRRSWTQSQSKIHRETHSLKEQDPETLTMTPYLSHASETENQKISKVSGEWQHTPAAESHEKRGLQRRTILVQEFEAILGSTGKLPTYNTIQYNRKRTSIFTVSCPLPSHTSSTLPSQTPPHLTLSVPFLRLVPLYHLRSTILPPLKSSQYPPSKFLTLWIFHFKHTYLKDAKPRSTPESEPAAFVFLDLGYLHMEWLFPDPSIDQQIL